MFTFSEEGCETTLAETPPIPRLRLKFEVARQASSPSLCASVRAVPWADEAEQQLSRIAPSACQLSADVQIFGAEQRNDPGRDPRHSQDTFQVEVARQASSPILCASVPAVPWADESEEKLSRLALSICELSADVRNFGAGMPEVPGTDPLRYV